jgi:hypothetical protein
MRVGDLKEEEQEEIFKKIEEDGKLYMQNKKFFDKYFYYVNQFTEVEAKGRNGEKFEGKPSDFINIKETLKNKESALKWLDEIEKEKGYVCFGIQVRNRETNEIRKINYYEECDDSGWYTLK